ncbi:MAG TPA: heavy metal translocating P-type ATPase [Clostridia bacterium]|nr:heavy metal translocating P-type ATPase [Clostridia bacterium]
MKKNITNLIRIIASAILLVVAIITSRLLKLPSLVELSIFIVIYLAIGYDILVRAFKNILNGQIFDENFLMVIATVGAFIIAEYPEAVAVMVFYQAGEYFQNYAVEKSRKSIADLMDIKPNIAVIKKDGKELVVKPEDVNVGDDIIVKAGERVPLDGIIVEGSSSFDMSALTGESIPKFYTVGDNVLSGSINNGGVVTVRAEKVYYDSTVARILELVENASAIKAKAENFITKFAKYYTPIVVILAALLAFIPPIFNGQWSIWLYRALAFLVVSCPCALVVSVPLSFFGGIGGASRAGILIKGGNYMELLAKANIFVFDKTGTLTKGEFAIQEITPKAKADEILYYASICENGSNHPIAKSILQVKQPEENGYEITEIAGQGLVAQKDDNVILAGNANLMANNHIPYTANTSLGSIVYVARNGEFLGSIVIADKIKEDAKKVISALHKEKHKVIMLTGDNNTIATKISAEIGIDETYSELLPTDKVIKMENIINKKGKKDIVAFVGDGINDAPVIMRADVGIAMGGIGSDSAIEAADVVLMRDELSGITVAKKISKKTMIIVLQNIVFALAVKIIVLGLSAVGIASMWMAVFADVGVAFIAILNAMRAGRKIRE